MNMNELTLVNKPLENKKTYLALVIEDDITSKNVIILQLISLGIKVVEASTLVGGYELLRSIVPDVIFLDRELYATSGLELLRKRQNDVELKKIRVIVTTGSKDENAVVEALKLGADDYLMKPLSPVLLKNSLERLGFKLSESLLKPPKL